MTREPLTWKARLKILGILVTIVATATVIFALTYFLTIFLYQWLDFRPHFFVAQIINWVLGFIFFLLLMYLFAYLNRNRRGSFEMTVFRPIFEAMARIAKGDFSVQIASADENNPIMYELTKRVNSMALELNQLETMRQEFISNVSHEIQSPLTSIRGFAQALQNNDLNIEERSHYLTIIETESVRLSKLADNLLKLASLEAEQIKVEAKPYRLDKQIRNLLLMSEPQWTEKAIQIDANLAEVTINADEELLSQVWLNLIHNSIKFTPTGGNIGVTLCAEGEQAIFKISDTGIGIAESDQAHIFDRFFKADKARQRAKGGNGLGLSITHKIVEMHHGTIAVASQLGAGTTFTISLPNATAMNALPQVTHESLPGMQSDGTVIP